MNLAEHLGTLYQQVGGWDFLLEDRRLKRLYRLAGDEDRNRGKNDDHRRLQLLDTDKTLMGLPLRRLEVPTGERSTGRLSPTLIRRRHVTS